MSTNHSEWALSGQLPPPYPRSCSPHFFLFKTLFQSSFRLITKWRGYTEISQKPLSPAIRNKEVLPFETTWRKLKCMLLSDRSQSRKMATAWFNYMTLWKRKNKLQTQSKVQWLPRVGVGEGEGVKRQSIEDF